jgi:hypothetical protein
MFCAHGLVFGGTEGVGSSFKVLRPDSFSAVPRASGPVFKFCAPRLIFGDGSRFHVLRARTHFRRYRGRRVLFSCFARPDSFSAVQRASAPVLMFCAPGIVFGDAEGVVSLFHVFHAQTRFRRFRGRRLPFSCFARPDSFSEVPRASCPVFMFCVPRVVFGCTEGVVSRFLVLRAQTRFRWYRGRRLSFSSFARPDSFSTVPRASAPVFKFYASGLVFGRTDGVGTRFHVLRARNSFRRYRGRRVPFSCFARPDSFSAVLRASCPVFLISAPQLVFGGTEGFDTCFHVLRARNSF